MFWKRRELSFAQMNEDLALEITKTRLAKQPPQYLTEEIKMPDQSHAEWLTLNLWIVDYTIQKTLKSPAKYARLLNAISEQFVSYVSPLPCYRYFDEIANERMKEYADWFSGGLYQCGPTPLLTFATVVATHILKPPQTLGVGLSIFQQEQNGVDMFTDAGIVACLSHEISTSMIELSKLLKTLEEKVPGLFSPT